MTPAALHAKKKKKKIALYTALCLVFLALTAGYLFLRAANRAQENAVPSETETGISIAAGEADRLTQIEWRRDGEWQSVTLSGSVWQKTGDAHFPLNQTSAAALANAVCSITALRTVEEGTAADYGLETPALEVRVSYGEGTVYKYAVGDRNSFNDAYYFRDDDGGFYMINSTLPDAFPDAVDDWIVLDTAFSAAKTDVRAITVQMDGEERVLAPAEETDTGTETDADTDTPTPFDTAWDWVCELNARDWVCAYADADTRAALYGLDSTKSVTVQYQKTVAVTDTAQTDSSQTAQVTASYVLLFGNTDADGYVFYTPKDSTIVYRASAEVFQGLFGSAA